MKVLVACEESQTVCKAFRERGHEAYSCDILPCFSGSGTTAIACHNLKRRFICIEKDKDYYEASVKRLEDARKQLCLF